MRIFSKFHLPMNVHTASYKWCTLRFLCSRTIVLHKSLCSANNLSAQYIIAAYNRYGYQMRSNAHRRRTSKIECILNELTEATSPTMALLWLDSNAYVHNHTLSISHWLKRYPNANLIMGSRLGSAHASAWYVDAGVMLIRNTEWSRNFFRQALSHPACSTAQDTSKGSSHGQDNCIRMLALKVQQQPSEYIANVYNRAKCCWTFGRFIRFRGYFGVVSVTHGRFNANRSLQVTGATRLRWYPSERSTVRDTCTLTTES